MSLDDFIFRKRNINLSLSRWLETIRLEKCYKIIKDDRQVVDTSMSMSTMNFHIQIWWLKLEGGGEESGVNLIAKIETSLWTTKEIFWIQNEACQVDQSI
jgi:hypothetical protein